MKELHVAIDGACWSNDRGFGRFTRELVRALVLRGPREGLRYTIILEGLPPDTHPERRLPEGVAIRRVGVKPVAEAVVAGGARGPLHLARIGRAIESVGANVVFFPAIYSWAPVASRVPQVLTIHDAIPERFPELVFPARRNRMLWLLKSALARRRARRVLTVSQSSAREIAEHLGVPPTRIDVTVEAADARFTRCSDADADIARAALKLPPGPLLLYVGGFNPHKNVLALLEALRRLPAPCPPLALLGDTSGTGFYDNLGAIRAWLSAHPEIATRVTMPGRVPDDVLVRLYSAATALVLPSLAEGFGLPAVEAMACGCPVLASDRTSLPEVVGDGGLLFDPQDPAAIAGAIARVVGDESLAADLRQRAIRRAGSFSWDRGAALTEVSLRRAMEDPP